MVPLQRDNPLETWQEIRQNEKVIEQARQHWAWAQTEADEEYFWSQLQEAEQYGRDLVVKAQREKQFGRPISFRPASTQ